MSDSLRQPAQRQLRIQQACLDRLAEPHFIGEDHARRGHRQRLLDHAQLVGMRTQAFLERIRREQAVKGGAQHWVMRAQPESIPCGRYGADGSRSVACARRMVDRRAQLI